MVTSGLRWYLVVIGGNCFSALLCKAFLAHVLIINVPDTHAFKKIEISISSFNIQYSFAVIQVLLLWSLGFLRYLFFVTLYA